MPTGPKMLIICGGVEGRTVWSSQTQQSEAPLCRHLQAEVPKIKRLQKHGIEDTSEPVVVSQL